MAACHHGAGYPSCPPAKVSKEFNEADKGGKLLAAKRPGGHGKPMKKSAR